MARDDALGGLAHGLVLRADGREYRPEASAAARVTLPIAELCPTTRFSPPGVCLKAWRSEPTPKMEPWETTGPLTEGPRGFASWDTSC